MTLGKGKGVRGEFIKWASMAISKTMRTAKILNFGADSDE